MAELYSARWLEEVDEMIAEMDRQLGTAPRPDCKLCGQQLPADVQEAA